MLIFTVWVPEITNLQLVVKVKMQAFLAESHHRQTLDGPGPKRSQKGGPSWPRRETKVSNNFIIILISYIYV